ncbi:MAG TPA: hypothetical protein VK909_19170 [Anaerolineales bacterium]|nr:hypothetical protein [Anaerolineales bacterium]
MHQLNSFKTKIASVAPAVAVGFSFLLSRFVYLQAGLRFDNTPPKYYYQFIDPQLLKTRLFESIWYLHGQPPLFNVLTGVLYQFFSSQSKIYQLLFLALGLVFSFVLYWLGLHLGLKKWVSVILTIWFMVSPATVLYENLYFYTYLTAFLLVFATLALSKFLETENLWWGISFFSSLAGLCLTWAIFHLFWMIAVILLVAVFYRDWRQLVLVSLIPVLLVFGWYAKNYFLFGTFSASSWVGMNLSHVTFLSPLTPLSVRKELEAAGLTHYPPRDSFRRIQDYDGLIPTPVRRGIPVLDEEITSTAGTNFNHSFYLQLSPLMLKDAIRFIRLRPGLYLASVKQGFMIYFHSSSDYLLLKDKTTPTLESFWDKIFYGQLNDYRGDFANRWKNSPIYVGWFLVIAYVAAAAYGLKVILSLSKYDVVFVAIIAFMTFTILYFTFAANFFDLGENNRFRFTLDPLVLLIAGHLLQNWLFKRERRST